MRSTMKSTNRSLFCHFWASRVVSRAFTVIILLSARISRPSNLTRRAATPSFRKISIGLICSTTSLGIELLTFFSSAYSRRFASAPSFSNSFANARNKLAIPAMLSLRSDIFNKFLSNGPINIITASITVFLPEGVWFRRYLNSTCRGGHIGYFILKNSRQFTCFSIGAEFLNTGTM
jgi:hypothetical protein